ncbi:MAG TPA: hydrogenase 4 membrane subunit [Xanthobacteraceae bacterium]|nr:hydrogenase 4 membrane subunit [Xanthobacteraceae bacterium]
MTGLQLVNGLASLLIVTSLLVIEARGAAQSALYYALQSLVLVLVFLALAATVDAPRLFAWAAIAFVTKVVLVPAIMYRTLGRMSDPTLAPRRFGLAWTIIFAAAVVAVCFAVVSAIHLPGAATLKPALAISLAHFFLGLTCIVIQRNLLKQVFGFCLMENGSHLTLALMANQAPELVEIGLVTDAIFAVVVMVIIATMIRAKLQTLDVGQLTSLRG